MQSCSRSVSLSSENNNTITNNNKNSYHSHKRTKTDGNDTIIIKTTIILTNKQLITFENSPDFLHIMLNAFTDMRQEIIVVIKMIYNLITIKEL